jgi:hypothetical protein
MTLEVFGKAATAADPGERAFDDPAFGENDETMQLTTLDDLDGPSPGVDHGGGQLRSLVVGVGEDVLDEGEQAAGTTIKDQARAVAVLHIGGVDDDVQQEAERVDKNVPFAARDLLARVVALRIDRGPPFCAPLALCASMIAALGLASRPACSRTAR